jgi:2',3'-cyclic-nucleotide 2'-phosphodiesterase (5'-nucleotidase family)
VFDEGAAEIVAHDPQTQRLFVVNGSANTIDVIDLRDPAAQQLLFQIDLGAALGTGSVNSVAVRSGLVAVAYEADPVTSPGKIGFYTTDGVFQGSLPVGALPDMLTFSPDVSKVLVANEGEADGGIDPPGSVSIVDLATATVTTVGFDRFNGRENELRAEGIRISPGNTAAADLEPEYIAVADGKAYVTLQEANALAVIDIAQAQVDGLVPLGVKNHASGQPVLDQFPFADLPPLGTTPAGQTIHLGGFSGLWFEGTTADGKLRFVTVPDRGPNGEPTNVDGDPVEERPFALPEYQARIVPFTVDPETRQVTIDTAGTIPLFRADGTTPISGRPNIAAPVDEEPVDLNGNPLALDPFGADLEGIAHAADGTFWMVDEYRPAIYHFSATGTLIDRFVPTGTAALAGGQPGDFGDETLPAEYVTRRANRGFEAVALDDDNGIVYAFIQSPLANPNTATSNASDIIRILGINTADGTAVAEFVYLLERPEVRPGGAVDKIGDAAYAGDGRFFVIERDASTDPEAKKFVFEIDISKATNLIASPPALDPGQTLEQLTAETLATKGILPVTKIKVANLPSLGYLAGDKPEGLALLDDGRLAVLNDNDFGLLGEQIPVDGSVPLDPDPVPVTLGLISFGQGNGFDASDRDNAITIANHPVYGLYQPDAIAAFQAQGQTYLVTANEGDARDPEVARVASLTLDPAAFPDAADLQQDAALGRLNVSTLDGDADGDGAYEALYAFGARSFSIWDASGNLVFDSGDQFEQVIKAELPREAFNTTNSEQPSFDNRSDDKGPEPEAVTIGTIGGQTFAFIGLERVGGVMVYNITDPHQAQFVGYSNNRNFTVAFDEDSPAATIAAAGDLGPEGLVFVPEGESPTGAPVLVAANEVSGTTTTGAVDLRFTLQLLHASDLEGGVDAIGRAANFAAIIDRLEDDPSVDATIRVSAGDNYIPGPFFNAASDASVRPTLQSVNTALFTDQLNGATLNNLREAGGRADVTIMNVVGFDASALGNHEFDLGTPAVREIIATDIRGSTVGDVRWLGAQFPYLSANLDFGADGSLKSLFTSQVLPTTAFQSQPDDLAAAAAAPKIAPSAIIERGGERIGVVGATTPLLESISSPGSTQVRDPGSGTNDMVALASLLQPVIDDLTGQGINKIVLTTHLQQIQLEQQLVPLLRGVDISIAGGSDTLLANPDDTLRPGDAPFASYPIVTQDADGNPAVIVSTDGEYSYVGQLVVTFDPEGILVDAVDNPVDDVADLDLARNGPVATTDDAVQALYGTGDPFAAGSKGALVRQVTDSVSAVVTAKDGLIAGETEVFLEGRRSEVRTQETNLGNLSADANLAVAKAVDPAVLVSIKNGGGIRAEIGEIDNSGGATNFLPPQANPVSGKLEGEVSQLDIENALRFNNGLTVLTVTAQQLKEVLEHAVAATAPGKTPGQFGQVGGIAFSYDPSLPARQIDGQGNQTQPGQRVQSAAIVDTDGSIQDVLVANGVVDGDPARPIRLVTLKFLADGGDNYPFPQFVAADPAFADRVDLATALTDPGDFTFAAPGTEQDALAEFLGDAHPKGGGTPFDVVDTPAAIDNRIQDLSVRPDTVLNQMIRGTTSGEPVTGTEGGDTLIGLDGAETLTGLGGDDDLRGGAGGDDLRGGPGADLHDGGDGVDTANYETSAAGISVDLATNAGFGPGDAAGDRYLAVENVRGTPFVDVLIGNAGDNRIQGLAGADLLIGSLGADSLEGGADSDRFAMSSISEGSDVILDFGAAENDVIDLTTLFAAHGLSRTDPVGQGILLVQPAGAGDTAVSIDLDGVAGPAQPSLLVTLSNVAPSALDVDLHFAW